MTISDLLTALAEISFVMLSVAVFVFFAMYLLLVIYSLFGIDAKFEIKIIDLKMSNCDDD